MHHCRPVVITTCVGLILPYYVIDLAVVLSVSFSVPTSVCMVRSVAYVRVVCAIVWFHDKLSHDLNTIYIL